MKQIIFTFLLVTLFLPSGFALASLISLDPNSNGTHCGPAYHPLVDCTSEELSFTKKVFITKGLGESDSKWQDRKESICSIISGDRVETIDGEETKEWVPLDQVDPRSLRSPGSPIVPPGQGGTYLRVTYWATCKSYEQTVYKCEDTNRTIVPSCPAYFNQIGLDNYLSLLKRDVSLFSRNMASQELSFNRNLKNQISFWCYIDAYKEIEIYDYAIEGAMNDARARYKALFGNKHENDSFDCDSDKIPKLESQEIELEEGVFCKNLTSEEVITQIEQYQEAISKFEKGSSDWVEMNNLLTRYDNCSQLQLYLDLLDWFAIQDNDLQLIKNNIMDQELIYEKSSIELIDKLKLSTSIYN